MNFSFKKSTKAIVAGILLISMSLSVNAARYYVDSSVSSSGVGNEWGTAYKHLQEALLNASLTANDEIWVAAGTYYPDYVPDFSNPGLGTFSGEKFASFQIPSGVKLYGGFNGTEQTLSERTNWESNQTTLSGEIGAIGSELDNSYCILSCNNSVNFIIDGFYITKSYYSWDVPGGIANAVSITNSSGTINNCNIVNCKSTNNISINSSQNVTVNNCDFHHTFGDNASLFCSSSDVVVSNSKFRDIDLSSHDEYNGIPGIYSVDSDIEVDNCIFKNNIVSSSNYGTVHIKGETLQSQAIIQNCIFENLDDKSLFIDYNNTGQSHAIVRNCIFDKNINGNIFTYVNNQNKVDFINCTLYKNSSVSSNSIPNCAIYSDIALNAEVNITNCIFWNGGNGYELILKPGSVSDFNVINSVIQENTTYIGNNNLSYYPLFSNAEGHDFHLRRWSPCVNAGDNSNIHIPTLDIEGNNRILQSIVDIGAYETNFDLVTIIRVDIQNNNIYENDGTSWDLAFTHFQDALYTAMLNPEIEQIWVAAGTYYPDWLTNPEAPDLGFQTNNKTSSFLITDGIEIYGGFNGTELTLSERTNWEFNQTTLSGEIGAAGSELDNSYCILSCNNLTNFIIDGFYITKSYYCWDVPGGVANAVSITNSSGTINNCNIVNCKSTNNISINSSQNVTVNNCDFHHTFGDNSSIFCSTSDVVISNSKFRDIDISSHDEYNGIPGIYSVDSDIEVDNCTFKNNLVSTSNYGTVHVVGESLQSQALIKNCVFENLDNKSLFIDYKNTGQSHAIVRNCIFDKNINGNIFTYANNQNKIDLINCTLYKNSSVSNNDIPNCAVYGDIALNAEVNITNCIFWNGGDGYEIILKTGSINDFNVQYCDIEGSGPYHGTGTTNISYDPYFVDPLNHDLHLQSKAGHWDPSSSTGWTVDDKHSVCIDFGDSSPYINEPSPNGSVINIGAYGNTVEASKSYEQCIIYVNQAVSGGFSNGDSWANAYSDLHDALDIAEIGCEIWVAQGTYRPSQLPFDGIDDYEEYLKVINDYYKNLQALYPDALIQSPPPMDITLSTSDAFKIPDGVAIYGGFDGLEHYLFERDWNTNITILSGDIGVLGVSTDNCKRIFAGLNISNKSIIDGFTLTDAYSSTANGSAICVEFSTIDVNNCIIEDNLKGMHIISSEIKIDNCDFIANDNTFLGAGGGGLISFQSDINIMNCGFKLNKSIKPGGAIYSTFGSDFIISNSSFIKNKTESEGGAIYMVYGSNINISHCVFAENNAKGQSYLDIGGGAIFNKASNLDINFSTFCNNTANSGGNTIESYYYLNSPTCNITNSILWNFPYYIPQIEGSQYTTTAYSNIIAPTGTIYGNVSTNLNDDPLFVEYLDYDFHLLSTGLYWDNDGNSWSHPTDCSPCINSGDNTPSIEPDASVVNMGAYGNTESASLTCLGTIIPTVNICNILNEDIAEFGFEVSPNPFNQLLSIRLSLPIEGFVNISVYDITGKNVKTINSKNFCAGRTTIFWDGTNSDCSNVPNGLYIVKVETINSVQSQKVVLQR